MAEKKATSQQEKPDSSKPKMAAKTPPEPSTIPNPPETLPETPPETPPETTQDGPQEETLEEPTKTGRFDPEKLSHKNDAAFLAVADATVPKEAETWQHPKNEKIVFCYGLGQMIAGKELNLKRASRDLVLEWLYVRIWMSLSLGGACKNIEAASVILKLFMILPRRVATQIVQNTVVNAGRKQIGSPSTEPVDGNWGPKTRGAIYSELCSHYEQTEKALHGQVYAKFQEYAGSDPDSWGPVLQAFATDRL